VPEHDSQLRRLPKPTALQDVFEFGLDVGCI